MRRSSSHPSHCVRATLLALGAFLGSDCVGTPLPEPPDELPRPEFVALEGPPAVAVAAPAMEDTSLMPVDIRVASASGAVPAGSRVWAINLDAPGAPPVETLATPLGGFQLVISAADKQRVRIVARTAGQHSAPLDLVAVVKSAPVAFGYVEQLRDTRLACLQVTPAETLRLSDKRGTVTLRNQCSGSVTLERAALRLGDQGIALEAPPSSLAPGQQAVLTFTDSQRPAKDERLDVLLLDVRGSDGLSGSYAIDLFSELD